MPPRVKADTMAARIERIEKAQSQLKGWQSKHERECLKVYNQIMVQTSVLPSMKKQLDDQDVLLSGLRDVKATIRVSRPIAIGLGAIVASAVGLVEILQYVAEHFG